MKMSAILPLQGSLPMELPSIASRGASPAKTQALRTLEEKASRASALGFTEKSCGSFANWNPKWSCWKTSQTSLTEGLETFSGPWPRRGMMRNGIASLLPTLGPGIDGTEYGYLPTPNSSSMGKGASRSRYFSSTTYRGNLQEYLRNGPDDPIYPHPRFTEALMGFPPNWTATETP